MKIWNPKRYYHMFKTSGKKTTSARYQKLESQTLKDTTALLPLYYIRIRPSPGSIYRIYFIWLSESHFLSEGLTCQTLWLSGEYSISCMIKVFMGGRGGGWGGGGSSERCLKWGGGGGGH